MNEDAPGPADYVVVEFSDPATVRTGFDRLSRLAGTGAIRVLDVEFIRSIKGVASTVPAGRVDPDLAVFDAADSTLLGQADLDIVVDTLTTGTTAVVVVYAGAPMGEVRGEWESGGSRVVRSGPVDSTDLAAAVDRAPGVSLLRAQA